MACEGLVINYGVPDTGATEYTTNSGREIFRCGKDCVKMFITNVNLEKSTVTFSCGSIADAKPEGVAACLQSLNATGRDQITPNWIGKNGANSSWANGSVLNKVGDCEGGSGLIYSHTEGTLNFNALFNVDQISVDFVEKLKNHVISKMKKLGQPAIFTELEWIFSDVSSNVNVNDWQAGSGSYQGFGIGGTDGHERTARLNFNWDNGQTEKASGEVYYDDGDDPSLPTIISGLIAGPTPPAGGGAAPEEGSTATTSGVKHHGVFDRIKDRVENHESIGERIKDRFDKKDKDDEKPVETKPEEPADDVKPEHKSDDPKPLFDRIKDRFDKKDDK